ncbi:MAG: hypothetical protein Q8R92_07245 [Deltaproteobacteria bacterium]|nr:hypothetical protein [Deltaproteobacteria bacterium]
MTAPDFRFLLVPVLLVLIALPACTEQRTEPAPDEPASRRDVSEYLPGDGPEAPAWAPRANAPVAKPQPLARAPQTTEDPGASIRGVIGLAPDAKAQPGAVLFIIARPAGGPGGPPVAVKRIAAPEFPLTYALTAADSMAPGQPLQGRVNVTVRLDTDGNASTREAGDLVGAFGANPAEAGQSGVDIQLAPPQP